MSFHVTIRTYRNHPLVLDFVLDEPQQFGHLSNEEYREYLTGVQLGASRDLNREPHLGLLHLFEGIYGSLPYVGGIDAKDDYLRVTFSDERKNRLLIQIVPEQIAEYLGENTIDPDSVTPDEPDTIRRTIIIADNAKQL